MIRIGVISPSEIAFRRFLPSLSKVKGVIFSGVAVASEKEWTGTTPNPNTIENRLDSRGFNTLSTSLFMGVGRTFKSGYLNIPVNLYVMPRKEGTIAGFSFGFNIYKKPKVN